MPISGLLHHGSRARMIRIESNHIVNENNENDDDDEDEEEEEDDDDDDARGLETAQAVTPHFNMFLGFNLW